MSKNLDAIFQALSEAYGEGVMNENVKENIRRQAGSDGSVDNIYEAVEKVLGPGVVSKATRQNTLKRADAILAGNAHKTEPAKQATDKEDKQQAGTITDTGENKDVGALLNEGFEATGGGPAGNRNDAGAARSQVSAATNSGSNFGSGPGGSINTNSLGR